LTPQIINGRKLAEDLKATVALEVKQLRADGIACGLATVVVGDDYGAKAYERRLARIAVELDVPHRPIALEATSTQNEVVEVVRELTEDPAISGVVILRPLPRHISEAEVFQTLSPLKDIEAVHPENAGLLALGTPRYVPSTAASVFHALDSWLDENCDDRAAFYHRSLIVVVGRSNNVGKPAVSLAYNRQAAVESVDEWASRNGQLGWHTRRADVLIVAAGVPRLIRAEHIREGTIVLDVGVNPVRDAQTGTVRMVGDVDFDDVAPRARAITPVPGGIGPLTDAWLLRNTVIAARNCAQRAANSPGPPRRLHHLSRHSHVSRNTRRPDTPQRMES
jgi:methylenetetrahydrofolate dehydrogenase (NADP+)/methenyltetrahydrofolate cyclohydrolase